MRAIIVGGPPNVENTVAEINSQVLAELPSGRWEYVNVGGGKHVDIASLDPFKDYTYSIENNGTPGQFAIIEDDTVNTAMIRGWDNIPASVKSRLAGKFQGGRPSFVDDLTDNLGPEWFNNEEI